MRWGWAAALLVVACGCGAAGPGEPPPPSASPPPASPPSAAPPAASPRAVALPTGGRYVWRLSPAPDGATALVGRSAGFFPDTRESSIYELSRGPDGGWATATEVPFVGADTADLDPSYSADGSRVLFSSIRPVDGVARPDTEVWSVERRPDGSWGEPEHVAAVSSPEDDLFPSVGPDGTLYVGSDRGGAGFDIWAAPPAADGGWGTPAPLPAPVTTPRWEFNPAVSPDGSLLVFTARGRDGGEGSGDLFASRAGPGGWGEPAPVEAVNGTGDEYHPSFSPDGRTLYFVRNGTLQEVPAGAVGPAD